MPFVRITYHAGPLDDTTRRALSSGATRIMVDVLHKRAELTAVLVEANDCALWSIGGRPLDPNSEPTAFVDARITRDTNSAAQIATAIAAFHALLQQTLRQPAEASYVVIDELPAEHWGYAGLTQQARHDRRRAAAGQPKAIDYAYYDKRARRLRALAWRSWTRRAAMRLRALRRADRSALRSAGRTRDVAGNTTCAHCA